MFFSRNGSGDVAKRVPERFRDAATDRLLHKMALVCVARGSLVVARFYATMPPSSPRHRPALHLQIHQATGAGLPPHIKLNPTPPASANSIKLTTKLNQKNNRNNLAVYTHLSCLSLVLSPPQNPWNV